MSLKRLLRSGIGLICFISCSTLSFAQGFETFDHLQTIAKDFVMKSVSLQPDETVDVQVHLLDAASKLPHCSNNIEPSLPENSNREQITAVKLACSAPQPWQIFLPVTTQILTNVLVTTRAISPKDIITATDIEPQPYNKAQLIGGYFQDKSQVVGQEAALPIPAGVVLNEKNLRSPVLVRKGQAIRLMAENGPVTVSVTAIAKSDGRLNDTIKVINPSSQRMLDAVVTGENQAKVLG